MTSSKAIVSMCLVLSSGLIDSRAQSSPARETSDQVMELSPFTVSSVPDGSYVASETITGSRVNEKIKNLPYQVNVVTSEFLKDFAFFDMHDDDFTYTSAFVSGDTPNGGAQIRGLGLLKSLRNGFSRIGLIIDSVNVDRIEIIKGPSAAVYGENRPGGIVNFISKRPKTRPGFRISATGGSYGFSRGELEVTGPIGASKKTAVLVAASWQERHYEQDFATFRRRTESMSLSHQFGPATSLLLELEHLQQHTGARSAIPLVRDTRIPSSGHRFLRLATAAEVPYALNSNGPQGYTDREVTSGTMSFEHRFNPVWSLKSAAAFYWINRSDFSQSGTLTYELSGPSAGTIGNRSPGYGWINEQAAMAQIDLLAHTFFANRRIENRTLLTFDFASNYHIDPQWRLPSSGPGSMANLVATGRFMQRMDPQGTQFNWASPEFNPANFPTINRWARNRTDVYGVLLREQIALWQGRFIAAAGMRFDFMRFRLQEQRAARQTGDPTKNITERTNEKATTPNAGINFALTENVRSYLNYSESFYPDTQGRKAVAGPHETTNEGGFGWDYGFKAGFLDDRLNFTIGGFFVKRTNILVNELDEVTHLPVQRRIGATLSRGVEFDANWRVTESLSATLGGSKLSSIVTENGVDVDSVGRPTPRTPDSNLYLTLRYSWRIGALRGLSANLGVTYTGKAFPFANAGQLDVNRDQIFEAHDGRRTIMVPGYTSTRGGVRYTWKPADSRFSHSVGVTASNLLNRRYVKNNARWSEPLAALFTYSISH